MRALALVLFIALPAHADLYRWVDPDSGSVKLSNLPPSDPRVSAELVPFRNPAAPAREPAAGTAPKPAPSTLAALEARWSELLAKLSAPAPQDLTRAGEGLRQHAEAYEAVRAELDRLDPAGAARRRSESGSLLERLRQGFAAQFGTTPPGQQK